MSKPISRIHRAMERCPECGTFSGLLPGEQCRHLFHKDWYRSNRDRLLEDSDGATREAVHKMLAPPETVVEHLRRIGLEEAHDFWLTTANGHPVLAIKVDVLEEKEK